MLRTLSEDIKESLEDKIVLLMGPRQCGKTTLAKQLFREYDYFNYDAVEDRITLKEKSWDRLKPLLILDEVHKMREWKRWVKGIYDKEGVRPRLLVTGSTELNTYRKAGDSKVGDSLSGRYFQYSLFPLDLKEVARYDKNLDPTEIFDRLWHCSGFPEPFFKGSETYYKRWRRGHLDIILRQDLLDLQAVRDIQAIEVLVSLLKGRVGSTVSYSNLARDIERDINTVKRWLQLLENLYIIFRVTPYSKSVARAILKEPKYYFFDIAQVEDHDQGARLENLVALSLLKELRFIEDTTGNSTNLHFVRTKDGKELDFLICQEKKPTHLIEVKGSDDSPSNAFMHFRPSFPDNVKTIQLVKNLKREKTFAHGLQIRSLIPWLTNIKL